jgi:hypothetical protein
MLLLITSFTVQHDAMLSGVECCKTMPCETAAQRWCIRAIVHSIQQCGSANVAAGDIGCHTDTIAAAPFWKSPQIMQPATPVHLIHNTCYSVNQ